MSHPIKIINELSKRKCSDQELELDEIAECPKLSFHTQNAIACFVTSVLKRNYSNENLNLIEASKSLQEEFIISPLSDAGESMQGMTFKVRFKGTKEPFAVMKNSTVILPIVEDNILHEIAIGLMLNEMRKFTPNFMFTYGGFTCTPPVDRKRIEKEEELNNLIYKVTNMPGDLNSLYFEILENVGETNPENRKVFCDYLHVLINYNRNVYDKLIREPNILHVMELKNELRAVINETEIFSNVIYARNPSEDAEKLKHYLSLITSMIETIDKLKDKIEESIKYLDLYKPSVNEQLKMFCSNEDKAILLLTEFFDNAKPFEEFLRSNVATKKEINEIVLQVVLSLIIANKKIGFKHNDLHPGNILIQKNNCELTYVLGEQEITFQSNYIARIIDYGFSQAKFEGEIISPIDKRNDVKFLMKKSTKRSDFKHLRSLVNEYQEFFGDYTRKLLKLNSYEEMEEFILTNY